MTLTPHRDAVELALDAFRARLAQKPAPTAAGVAGRDMTLTAMESVLVQAADMLDRDTDQAEVCNAVIHALTNVLISLSMSVCDGDQEGAHHLFHALVQGINTRGCIALSKPGARPLVSQPFAHPGGHA